MSNSRYTIQTQKKFIASLILAGFKSNKRNNRIFSFTKDNHKFTIQVFREICLIWKDSKNQKVINNNIEKLFEYLEINNG